MGFSVAGDARSPMMAIPYQKQFLKYGKEKPRQSRGFLNGCVVRLFSN
jgi:hypothetical protein